MVKRAKTKPGPKSEASGGASSGTITAEKLCLLTGLTDRRHRQLASSGYFPPPIRGQYQTSPTIQGLFKYYRETGSRAHILKEKLAEEKLKAAQRDNAAADGDIVSKAKVVEELAKSLLEIREALKRLLEQELPISMSGMGVAENRIIGKRQFDAICELMAALFENWKV